MEAATAAARGVSLSQSSSRKQWRAVSEHSVRNSATEVFFIVFFYFDLSVRVVFVCEKWKIRVYLMKIRVLIMI